MCNQLHNEAAPFCPGTVALPEIYKLQKSTKMVTRKRLFVRFFSEISQEKCVKFAVLGCISTSCTGDNRT